MLSLAIFLLVQNCLSGNVPTYAEVLQNTLSRIETCHADHADLSENAHTDDIFCDVGLFGY